MFLSAADQQISEEYLQQGYIIRPVTDLAALEWLREQIISLIHGNIEQKQKQGGAEL
ncbi:MAG: hypothetical protein AAFZ49_08395 [Cyanobacteria bacterium J06659_2]